MDFRQFETSVKRLPMFNLNDIRKIDPGFHRPQLSYWQKKGLIKPIAGGYYALVDRNINEDFLFMAANKIYEPSYISLESALAYHLVIPESVLGVTSISSRKTTYFDSNWGGFQYRSIKAYYLVGYQAVDAAADVKFKIAKIEKAVLDYLYLNPGIKRPEDFESLRWNREQLQSALNTELMRKYIKIFDKNALRERVNILKEYLHA